MGSQKVVIIGIDGGELTVMKEMIKRSLMPNMDRIVRQSFVEKMDCYVRGPGQGWASFMTGKSPVKHGLFYWKIYLGVTSSDIKDKKIWDVLGENGRTSGVVNLSYTFPPSPINGFMISGLGGGLSPRRDLVYSYPDGLVAELENHASGYVYKTERVYEGLSALRDYLQDVIKMTQKRGEACLYLLKKYDPDFFMVVFRGADAIQHTFWHFLDDTYSISDKYKDLKPLIGEYYKTLDYYVGKIWVESNSPYKHRFIISDHGFGPTKAIIYINEYLSSQGMLVKKKDIKSKIGNVYFLKAKPFFAPFYRKYMIKYKFFANLNKLREKKLHKIGVAIAWDQSVLYARCPHGVCFNRKVVNNKEKEDAIFEDIKNRLLSLRDPDTGNSIFHSIYRKERLKIKRHANDAPDILFEMADESYIVLPDICVDHDMDFFQNLSEVDIAKQNGSHRRNGLLIMDVKDIDAAPKRKDINITDIYATTLKILGTPIPDDVDGRPLF